MKLKKMHEKIKIVGDMKLKKMNAQKKTLKMWSLTSGKYYLHKNSTNLFQASDSNTLF